MRHAIPTFERRCSLPGIRLGFPGSVDAFRQFSVGRFMPTGHCPSYFFGGRLLALSKKSGGIRPIAVGLTLCCSACKCTSSFGSKRSVSSFHPRQLGVGVAGGCEADIHSARRFMENMPSDYVVVKLRNYEIFETTACHKEVWF